MLHLLFFYIWYNIFLWFFLNSFAKIFCRNVLFLIFEMNLFASNFDFFIKFMLFFWLICTDIFNGINDTKISWSKLGNLWSILNKKKVAKVQRQTDAIPRLSHRFFKQLLLCDSPAILFLKKIFFDWYYYDIKIFTPLVLILIWFWYI